MDEPIVRALVVLGVAALAAVFAWVVGRGRGGGGIPWDPKNLDPGVYLFTSSSCLECHSVRDSLAEAVGDDGFTEYSWESAPEMLDTLSIEEVPATLVVESSGRATLYPGPLERIPHSLSP